MLTQSARILWDRTIVLVKLVSTEMEEHVTVTNRRFFNFYCNTHTKHFLQSETSTTNNLLYKAYSIYSTVQYATYNTTLKLIDIPIRYLRYLQYDIYAKKINCTEFETTIATIITRN